MLSACRKVPGGSYDRSYFRHRGGGFYYSVLRTTVVDRADPPSSHDNKYPKVKDKPHGEGDLSHEANAEAV